MPSLAGFVENIPSSTRRRHTLPSVDQKPSTEKQRMTKLTKEILSKEKHSNIRNTLDKECGHTFPSVVSGCPLTLKSHITSSPTTNSPPERVATLQTTLPSTSLVLRIVSTPLSCGSISQHRLLRHRSPLCIASLCVIHLSQIIPYIKVNQFSALHSDLGTVDVLFILSFLQLIAGAWLFYLVHLVNPILCCLFY
jgi:hypothetical protein